MDPLSLAISGVVLIPLIIGLIQFVKQLDPGNKIPGGVWLVVSMVLGVGGRVVAFFMEVGTPTDFEGWAALVIVGLSFGLAASKSYDMTLRRRKKLTSG